VRRYDVARFLFFLEKSGNHTGHTMPNTKSAKRMMKTSEEKRCQNLNIKSAARTARKRVFESVEAGDKEASAAKLQVFYAATDKAVKKGALKKNTAARQKARTAKRVASI
jgi:small subunit ribosomal protein S20